jgi:superfamily II DNA or RNA helicase
MTRKEIYDKAIKDLKLNRSLMVEFATGVGKSMLAIEVIKQIVAKKGAINALIVVNSSPLRSQWKSRYVDGKGYGNVLVETKHEAYSKGAREFDLVVYDEADDYILNPDYGEVYNLAKGKYNLAMSAYFRPSAKEKMYSMGYAMGQTITRAEAELWKLITPTIVHNVMIPLSDIEKARVDSHGAKMREYDGMLPSNMGADKFKVYDPSFNRYAMEVGMEVGNFIGLLKKYNTERVARSNLTVLNPKKVSYGAEILNQLKLAKVISHSDLGSALYTLSGELVSEDVKHRKYLYNGERKSIKELEKELDQPLEPIIKSKRKDYIIEKMGESKVRILHSAKALSRGLDLPDINLGIRLSRTSSKEDTLQSVGRVRAEGTFIELCTLDTHEARDLAILQRGLGLGTIQTFTFKDYMEKLRDGETD